MNRLVRFLPEIGRKSLIPIYNRDKRDFFAVDFAPQSFQFLTALSVVEHGVLMRRYLRKAYELLKTGGFLLTSTDYWEEAIVTEDKYRRSQSGEEQIFGPQDITEIFGEAMPLGFELYDGCDFGMSEKLVHWKGKAYTFTFLVLRKSMEL